ncbi:MAG TPA: type II toxin-antitoxin system VapC family toxin [Rhizomicrobium sp.]|nr:type II toxin-antitoxin system VapC family toxin [Rhizomicrobium sp.]
MIILDTNVLSEATRVSPSVEVRSWLAARIKAELFTTTVSEAEMLGGVIALPAGKRRDELARDFSHVFDEEFADRILSFDSAAARAFPVVARRVHGKYFFEPDAQIAAIALAHGAVIATRNTRHFKGRGVKLINPWTGEQT